MKPRTLIVVLSLALLGSLLLGALQLEDAGDPARLLEADSSPGGSAWSRVLLGTAS